MPAAAFSVSVDIDVPQQAVFAYVSDLGRHGEWSANPLRVESVSAQPVGVGSRYRSTAHFNGLTIEAHFEVTEYEPPLRFGFIGEDSTGKFEHHFVFHERPGGTHVERRVSFNLTWPQWIMFLALLYPVRLPAGRQALQLLKQRLEQKPVD